MPIDVLRFGVGHRRPEGPPGTTGITGRVIHSDGRGVVSELAFGRGARIEPHSNPNTTYLIVIEGGGWAAVGDERIRVAAGEAVVWPADIEHAAWTDYSPMRAFVVEFAGPDDAAVRGIIDGTARTLPAGAVPRSPGEGSLAPRDVATPHDRTAGEPR
ncbi:MAG TPA: cupin domain-containing protein [Candidatus Limnocylindrales bacterium]|nr:cupin domain-containing protein [Candidatus Limnocylindrales bacterium]